MKLTLAEIERVFPLLESLPPDQIEKTFPVKKVVGYFHGKGIAGRTYEEQGTMTFIKDGGQWYLHSVIPKS